MDHSNAEAGLSVRPDEGFRPAYYRNISSYPAANNPKQLSEKCLYKFHSEYHIPRGVYYLYMPKPTDRVYHIPVVPNGFDRGAIGISKCAFKCGFRVPLLKLVRRLFIQFEDRLRSDGPERLYSYKHFSAQVSSGRRLPRKIYLALLVPLRFL